MVEWIEWSGLTPYAEATARMENRVNALVAGTGEEAILLAEHPPLYTAGTSAKAEDLLDPLRFPVFKSGRGGEHTYHGPGQRVVYPIIDLRRRGRDVRRYVQTLENWIIAALAALSVRGFTREGRVGVWVDAFGSEAKIAAIGVRVKRWVSLHGFSINVSPDLTHFGGIVPCGLTLPVTSLAALKVDARIADLDQHLQRLCPFRPLHVG